MATTYDEWKLRSDRDEQLPEEEQRRYECGACGGLDGDHDRRCPESDGACAEVDRGIDAMKEALDGDR